MATTPLGPRMTLDPSVLWILAGDRTMLARTMSQNPQRIRRVGHDGCAFGKGSRSAP